jgi:hypothetical protein
MLSIDASQIFFGTQHNDIQHYGTQHNDTECTNIKNMMVKMTQNNAASHYTQSSYADSSIILLLC